MKVKKVFNAILLGVLFITSVGAVVVSRNIVSESKLIYIDPGHGGSTAGRSDTKASAKKTSCLPSGKS